MAYLGKGVVFMEMERGSNLEPREHQKRTLYPLYQPHLAGTFRRALFCAKEFFVIVLNRYMMARHEIQILIRNAFRWGSKIYKVLCPRSKACLWHHREPAWRI